MKKILSYWPFLFYVAAIVLYIIGILNNEFEEDPMWAAIFYYGVLFPIVTFFLSVWVGRKFKSNKKWYFVLGFYLAMFILDLIACPTIISDAISSLMAATSSAAGILIGTFITKIKKPMKLSKVKNVLFEILSGIILFGVFIVVQIGSLFVLAPIQGIYDYIDEKIIVAKPEYKHQLPALYNIIEEFKLPNGYIFGEETYGYKEPYETILRESNQDEVRMSIDVVEYRNMNYITLQDVVRFNVYEEASRAIAKRWINSAKVSYINGAKVYRDKYNAIFYKDGTYIHATVDIGTLKITKEDEKAFDEIVNSIVIK